MILGDRIGGPKCLYRISLVTYCSCTVVEYELNRFTRVSIGGYNELRIVYVGMDMSYLSM